MKRNKITAVGIAFALSFTALQTDFLPTVFHSSFTSNASEEEIFSSNGILYELMDGEIRVLGVDTGEKKLIKENVVIPDSFKGFPVTKIAEWAFYKDSNGIKSFTLPDSIYDIGESAFFYITTLESVNIPKNVSVIQKETFRKCANLSDVKFHDDIEKIDITAFEETKVTIPENLV